MNQYVFIIVNSLITIALCVLYNYIFRNYSHTVQVILPTMLLGITTLIFIFTYGYYRCKNPEFKDQLEEPIFKGVEWFDGWSWSHFLFFLLIGLSLKGNWIALIIFFLIGCIWEWFEDYAGKDRFFGGCNMSTDKGYDKWWYGKWTDILVNGIGLILGFIISLQFNKNKRKRKRKNIF